MRHDEAAIRFFPGDVLLTHLAMTLAKITNGICIKKRRVPNGCVAGKCDFGVFRLECMLIREIVNIPHWLHFKYCQITIYEDLGKLLYFVIDLHLEFVDFQCRHALMTVLRLKVFSNHIIESN